MCFLTVELIFIAINNTAFLKQSEDKESAKSFWNKLCSDAELLGFDLVNEWLTSGLARLLAVIYHLGCAGYTRTTGLHSSAAAATEDEDCPDFANSEGAQRAAYLLQCPVRTLRYAIFAPIIGTNRIQNRVGWTERDCFFIFVQELYQIVVEMLLGLINRFLSTNKHTDISGKASTDIVAQLILIDPVGLQIPYCKQSPTMNHKSDTPIYHYPDLIYNYVYERFQQLYFDSTIIWERKRLRNDGVHVPNPQVAHFLSEQLIECFDKSINSKMSNLSAYSTFSVPPSLFQLIDEAAGRSDYNGFISKLYNIYQIWKKLHQNRDTRALCRVRQSGSFVLNHSLATVPIQYNPSPNWFLPYRRSDRNVYHNVLKLISESSLPPFRNLLNLLEYKDDYLSPFILSTSMTIGAASDIKSLMDTMIRSLFDTALSNSSPNPNNLKSCFNDGGSMNGLHWIQCFLPVANAGICQLINQSLPVDKISHETKINHQIGSNPLQNQFILSTQSSINCLTTLMQNYPNHKLICGRTRLCVNQIRSQLCANDLVHSLDLLRSSYLDCLSLMEFRDRFSSLLSSFPSDQSTMTVKSDALVAEEILNNYGYPADSYRIGKSQIFMRTYILPQLLHRLAIENGSTTEKEVIEFRIASRSDMIGCQTSPDNEQLSTIVLTSTSKKVNGQQPHNFQSSTLPTKLNGHSIFGANQEAQDLKICNYTHNSTNSIPLQQNHIQIDEKFYTNDGFNNQVAQLHDTLPQKKSVLSDSQLFSPTDNSINQYLSTALLGLKLEKRFNLIRSKAIDSKDKLTKTSSLPALPNTVANQHNRNHNEDIEQLRQTNHLLLLHLKDLRSLLKQSNICDMIDLQEHHQKTQKIVDRLRADLNSSRVEQEQELEATHSVNELKLRHLEEAYELAKHETMRVNREKVQLELEVTALNSELASLIANADDGNGRKLRKELQLTKSLLSEKEEIIEQLQCQLNDLPNVLNSMKALRDRIDELEELGNNTYRQKRSLQNELDDTKQMVEHLQRCKKELETALFTARSELIETQAQLSELEATQIEYQNKVQVANTTIAINETTLKLQSQEIDDLVKEKSNLIHELDELKIAFNTEKIDQIPRYDYKRLESKVRDLEQRLDTELNNRFRLQSTLDRTKEMLEQITTERDNLLISEAAEMERTRKLTRQLRETEQREEEANRRLTSIKRRAEEANDDADKANREAAFLRTELNSLTRRQQDLDSYVKSRSADNSESNLLTDSVVNNTLESNRDRRSLLDTRQTNTNISEDAVCENYENRLDDNGET